MESVVTRTPRTAVKGIAFDLDGTLINSAAGLAEAVDMMLSRLGYPTAGVAKVSLWIGHGAVNLVETALKSAGGDVAMQQFPQAFSLFNQFYSEVLQKGSELYPDVMETLLILKGAGLRLGIITNKPTRFLPDLLKELQLTSIFDLVLGADDVVMKKPHPAPLFKMLGEWGMLQSELLFVGDSRNDIQAAKAAGIASVGLTYGYNFGIPLADSNPTYLIRDFKSLLQIEPIKVLFNS